MDYVVQGQAHPSCRFSWRPVSPLTRFLQSVLHFRSSADQPPMSIDPDMLSSIASEYAKGMTSIRSRRVQRLVKREFAGAQYVLLAEVGSGRAAVLGLSASGFALCATDGRGKQASIVKWSPGSSVALEVHFDLYKDSLPVLSTNAIPLAGLRTATRLRLPADNVPPEARSLATRMLQVLA